MGFDASGRATVLVGKDLQRDGDVPGACVLVVPRGVAKVDAEPADR
jgi:hypothetical protein